MPRGLLGGLLGGLEIIEKPQVLCCFQQWGGLGVPCGRCFVFFFIYDRINDRFFVFRSYSRPFLVPGCPGGVSGECLRGSLGDLGWSLKIPGGSLGPGWSLGASKNIEENVGLCCISS